MFKYISTLRRHAPQVTLYDAFTNWVSRVPLPVLMYISVTEYYRVIVNNFNVRMEMDGMDYSVKLHFTSQLFLVDCDIDYEALDDIDILELISDTSLTTVEEVRERFEVLSKDRTFDNVDFLEDSLRLRYLNSHSYRCNLESHLNPFEYIKVRMSGTKWSTRGIGYVESVINADEVDEILRVSVNKLYIERFLGDCANMRLKSLVNSLASSDYDYSKLDGVRGTTITYTNLLSLTFDYLERQTNLPTKDQNLSTIFKYSEMEKLKETTPLDNNLMGYEFGKNLITFTNGHLSPKEVEVKAISTLLSHSGFSLDVRSIIETDVPEVLNSWVERIHKKIKGK